MAHTARCLENNQKQLQSTDLRITQVLPDVDQNETAKKHELETYSTEPHFRNSPGL